MFGNIVKVIKSIVQRASYGRSQHKHEYGKYSTPTIQWENYDYWAITMRAMFASQDLWELVEDGLQEPADENAFNALTQAEKYLFKIHSQSFSIVQ